MSHHSELIRSAEAARYLGLAPKTLERWRWRGDRGPAFIRVGSTAVRYRVADLDAFIAQGEVRQ